MANSIIAECKEQTVINNKRTTEEFDQKSRHLYLKYRKQIEDVTEIKEFITKIMTLKETSMIYFQNEKPDFRKEYCIMNSKCRPHPKIEYQKDYFPLRYVKKIFETTSYGDKILLEMLKEKFPNIVHVYDESFINNQYYEINIDWTVREVKRVVTPQVGVVKQVRKAKRSDCTLL